mmetsp:Transcript_18928/g.48136  ORF Transcript_18928/g.48136 Transcript_18928/m.48136 type:complete len:236 (-) Transcript_18928:14-721(-)
MMSGLTHMIVEPAQQNLLRRSVTHCCTVFALEETVQIHIHGHLLEKGLLDDLPENTHHQVGCASYQILRTNVHNSDAVDCLSSLNGHIVILCLFERILRFGNHTSGVDGIFFAVDNHFAEKNTIFDNLKQIGTGRIDRKNRTQVGIFCQHVVHKTNIASLFALTKVMFGFQSHDGRSDGLVFLTSRSECNKWRTDTRQTDESVFKNPRHEAVKKSLKRKHDRFFLLAEQLDERTN